MKIIVQEMARSGAPVPAVLGVNDTVLALELLPVGGGLGSTDSWTSLGHALAKLHSATNPEQRYGWRVDYAFGQLAIPNGWCDSWPRFWAERRLLVNVPHIPQQVEHHLLRKFWWNYSKFYHFILVDNF